MRILLTGGTGQLGTELRHLLPAAGEVLAPSRSEFDLSKPETLAASIRDLQPALIINAGAYTAVDRAEDDAEAAFAANAAAPGVLASEAARLGIPIVHYSTDYVFDGASSSPYTEFDAPAPVNVYGQSKLAGERAVTASGAAHLIFRTSWVYATHGRNFLRTIQRLAQEREELRVVNDQIGAPTPAALVAGITARVLGSFRTSGGFELPEDLWGCYHITTSGSTSWHGFAEAIVALGARREPQLCRRVVAVASDEFLTAARRPNFSLLDHGKLERTFGVTMPDWRTELERELHIAEQDPRRWLAG